MAELISVDKPHIIGSHDIYFNAFLALLNCLQSTRLLRLIAYMYTSTLLCYCQFICVKSKGFRGIIYFLASQCYTIIIKIVNHRLHNILNQSVRNRTIPSR